MIATATASEGDTYFTNQFHNTDCLAGYRTVGVELIDQFSKGIDPFCSGVEVAGLAMGVSPAFRDAELGTGPTVVTVAVGSGPECLSGDRYH